MFTRAVKRNNMRKLYTPWQHKLFVPEKYLHVLLVPTGQWLDFSN
jgi:hypothetical protein